MRTTCMVFTTAAALLLGSALFLASSPPREPARLDHAALVVGDLEKSAAFYEQVLGLQRIKSPFPESQILWLGAAGIPQLHIIQGEPMHAPREIGVHLAFRVASLDDFVAHLRSTQVKFRNFFDEKPTVLARPDGVRQIYLQDPDGYWIEVNDAR